MQQTIPRDAGTSAAAQDTANLGIVRPPLVYLFSIAIGLVLGFAWQLPFLPRALPAPVGGIFVVVALAFFLSSVGRFRAANTPVPAFKPTTAIVRTGPYRFSRNPIYLAFSLLQAGIAIWVNSLWVIATLIGAITLVTYVVIPREERYLERRFGAEYLSFKNSVRRWM